MPDVFLTLGPIVDALGYDDSEFDYAIKTLGGGSFGETPTLPDDVLRLSDIPGGIADQVHSVEDIPVGVLVSGLDGTRAIRPLTLDGAVAAEMRSYGVSGVEVVGFGIGGTKALPSVTQSDKLLVAFGGAGFGSAETVVMAGMEIYSDANWTGSSNPTRLSLFTTPVSSTTRVERLRVTPKGALDFIGITAPGASVITDAGSLYKESGDDGLKWHPIGGSVVDLTEGGGAFALADDVEGTFGGVPDASIQWENTGLDWEFNLKTQGEVHFLHNTELMMKLEADGSFVAYHNDVEKLSTESGGVVVTGNLEATKLVAGDGTAAAPSVTMLNDTDWGFYWIAANRIGLSNSGVKKFEFNVNGMESQDNVRFSVGDGGDTDWYFDGSDTLMDMASGDFYLRAGTTTLIKGDSTADSIEQYKDGTRVTVTTTDGFVVVEGQNLILDGDADDGSKFKIGAVQEMEMFRDSVQGFYTMLGIAHGSIWKFEAEDGAGTLLNLIQFVPNGPWIAQITPDSVPTGTPTNFPEIGSLILYRSASGAGSDLIAKCRVATSTYQTINLGTFAA